MGRRPNDWRKLIADHEGDFGWVDVTPPRMLGGTPGDIVDPFRKIRRMGFDEAIFRIDGQSQSQSQSHKQIMEPLEPFQAFAIPELRPVRELAVYPPRDMR